MLCCVTNRAATEPLPGRFYVTSISQALSTLAYCYRWEMLVASTPVSSWLRQVENSPNSYNQC